MFARTRGRTETRTRRRALAVNFSMKILRRMSRRAPRNFAGVRRCSHRGAHSTGRARVLSLPVISRLIRIIGQALVFDAPQGSSQRGNFTIVLTQPSFVRSMPSPLVGCDLELSTKLPSPRRNPAVTRAWNARGAVRSRAACRGGLIGTISGRPPADRSRATWPSICVQIKSTARS